MGIEYRKINNVLLKSDRFKHYWIRYWMRHADFKGIGRIATRLASWFGPPHKASSSLARLNKKGFIAPSAIIYHSDLQLGSNILIGDRVVIYKAKDGGFVHFDDNVHILRDSTIETGFGGTINLGTRTTIHPRCQLNAYIAPIAIGKDVMIAPNCAFYSYDHGMAPGIPINKQPLKTNGGIYIEDQSWIGVGVIVLSGVRIGKGAVIGAGSVVTKTIPDNAIAVGNPAKVVKMR